MRTGDDGANLVEMRLDIEFHGRKMLSCGGLWNRRMNAWEGDVDACKSAVICRIHAGQVDATTWFAKWLAVHAGRRDFPPQGTFDEDEFELDTEPSRVYSALLAGGRRAGKTYWASIAVVAYAVQFPGAIIWCVSPSRGRDDTKPDEIRRNIVDFVAPEWIRRQTHATGWELINGSQIMLKSGHAGHDPDAIKEGEAHLVWLNEAQKMVKRVYIVARGAINDKSGLVLCCANPPVEAKDQQWVSDFAAEVDAGKRAAVHLPFNPLNNPKVDRRGLLAMKHELDDRTFDIEVLGMFLPAIDSVAYNWLRKENERARPRPTRPAGGQQRECPRTGLVDVTEEFLEREEEGESISHLFGLDVQRVPYIGGPAYKFFAKPDRVPDRENVLAWIVGEEVLDGGDEEQWCFQLTESGYKPAHTLIVCDASGAWQHSRRRQADSPPPEWSGKGSFDIIRGAGWRRIVPPSRRSERKNPEITDRVRAFTSMIATKMGVRRLFADPELAPKSCKAIREWKTVNGKPSRIQDVAHLGDGISYPLIRLFPRILRSGNTGPGDPVAQRVDRPADRSEDFFGAPPAARGKHRRNYGL